MTVYPYATGLVIFDPQQLAGMYNAVALRVDNEGTILAFVREDDEWGWYDLADIEPVSASKKIRTQ